jgi:SDR family mycofactocin-dependent oxidoreductase
VSNRVAIVTGAARGIGARTALALAADGWSVALVDACRDDHALAYSLATRDDLHAIGNACGEAGADILVAIADVRDADAVGDAVARTVERFGRLDAAVAAAGAIAGGTPGWATSDAAWRAMLEINLHGVRHVAEAAIPRMLEAPQPRSGRFVAVASAAGAVGLLGLAPYAAAKHAVVGYVRALAADLADSGITANAVSPGSTRTAMLEASAKLYGLASIDELAVHHPSGRILEPEEPARAISWLCSAAASGVTGVNLPVDGGMTAAR